ncbi:MAG TPA: TlpA disulfide reductase family protein [Candidatus Kapabacteria bacterium]|nr:TlpA disulfide reductase family protein [Candidatus Kapabacteria bacterium]
MGQCKSYKHANRIDPPNQSSSIGLNEQSPNPPATNASINPELPKLKDFSFTTLSGVQESLHSLSGKKIVLDFWCLYCPGYQSEISNLNRLADIFKGDTNVAFLLIAQDAKSDMEEYCKSHPIHCMIIPEGTDICNKIDIERFPTYIVVNSEGRVMQKEAGGLEKDFDDIIGKLKGSVASN